MNLNFRKGHSAFLLLKIRALPWLLSISCSRTQRIIDRDVLGSNTVFLLGVVHVDVVDQIRYHTLGDSSRVGMAVAAFFHVYMKTPLKVKFEQR